ncbi:MAG: hypothetical protein ACJ72Z_14265 [Pyrinomonadaceae bacterium]
MIRKIEDFPPVRTYETEAGSLVPAVYSSSKEEWAVMKKPETI